MRFLDKFEDHANTENEFFHFLLDGTANPTKRRQPSAARQTK